MTHRFFIAVFIAASAALAGCHPLQALRNAGRSCHEVQPYTKAQSIAPLKMPAGLDSPDTSNALHIPALNAPEAPPRKRSDPCLDEPPSFKVAKPQPPQA